MKKWFYFIIFIVIIGAVYFFRYKTKPDFGNMLPIDAQAALTINLRQLEHHFLIDFISHPFSTKEKQDTSNTKPDKVSLLDVIKLPSHLLFYTKDKSQESNWISQDISIKDITKLKLFLEENGFAPRLNKNESIYSNGLFLVSIKAHKLRLAFSETIDIFLEKNNSFMSESDILLKQLTNNTSDILYVSEKAQIRTSFLNGKIEIEGNGPFDFLETNQIPIDTSDLITFETSFSNNNNPYKDKLKNASRSWLRKINISSDSLMNKMENISFVLSNIVGKVDTIKTYEYDDDFNKKEIFSTQTTLNPTFQLRIENDEAYQYLLHTEAIKNIEGNDVFINFPLVKTYIREDKNNVVFYSNNPTKKESQDKFESKLSLQINLDKYRTQSNRIYSNNLRFIKQINKINFSISADNKIQGRILMNNEDNALITLLKCEL